MTARGLAIILLVIAACGDDTSPPLATAPVRTMPTDARPPDAPIVDAGTPALPVSRAAVTQLALGDAHSCALHADGLVSCWGANVVGQLGDGTTAGRATPVRTAIADVVELAADGMRTCARRRDGTVWCWGAANHDDPHELVPVAIAGIANATQISAGCARASGTVRCWRVADRSLAIAGLDDAIHVASQGSIERGSQSCAVRASGAVTCWGSDGSLHAIAGVSGAVAVAVGHGFACARLRGGMVSCWGTNHAGELGRPPIDNMVQLRMPSPHGPGLVVGARDAVDLVAGQGGACILTSKQRVWCWGNADGTRGFGRPKPILGATQVAALEASVIAIGRSHTCVVRSDGVACWGTGKDGELGVDWNGARVVPTNVPGITDAVAVVAATLRTCVRRRGGTVACWGLGDATVREVPALADVVQLAGASDPCARDSRGRVTCLERQLRPRRVIATVTDAVDLDADTTYGCAVRAAGTVTCWGQNESGQFGNGTREPLEVVAPRPAAKGITDATAVVTGTFHTCVLRKTGEVECAGDDMADDTLDNGEHLVPTAVKGLADVRQLVTGLGYLCALRATGKVACWGANDRGQLGDGLTFRRNFPVDIVGLDGVVQLAAGDDTVCARLATGALRCWGANRHGQLGDGTLEDRTSPTPVAGITDAIDVSTADGHTCAVSTDGSVACWGHTAGGEVGTFAIGAIRRPVPVTWTVADAANPTTSLPASRPTIEPPAR